jgi:proteic killer suppression protein
MNLEDKTHCTLLRKFRSGILRNLNSLPLPYVAHGNRLNALVQDLAGYHAIRVKNQYRLVFRFEAADSEDVSCRDYQ